MFFFDFLLSFYAPEIRKYSARNRTHDNLVPIPKLRFLCILSNPFETNKHSYSRQKDSSRITRSSPSTSYERSLHEKRLNAILYIPVYGLHMPIYGSNLSQYGKIWDRNSGVFRAVVILIINAYCTCVGTKA